MEWEVRKKIFEKNKKWKKYIIRVWNKNYDNCIIVSNTVLIKNKNGIASIFLLRVNRFPIV